MLDVSNKIEIDLTKSLANTGVFVPFLGEYVLQNDLLPYPNATLQKISLNFSVAFLNPDVEVQGEIICFVEGLCDRCLKKVQKQIKLPFSQVFAKEGESDCDEEGYSYNSSLLDATKAVCDEIVLGLPTLFLCKDDCKGLCPRCGANKNKTECGCDAAKENAFSVLKNLKF